MQTVSQSVVQYLKCCDRWQYLSEGGSWGPQDLIDGINGYADDWGQSHGKANGQRPARVNVVIVGDGLVLDHCENQNELQREKGRQMWINNYLMSFNCTPPTPCFQVWTEILEAKVRGEQRHGFMAIFQRSTVFVIGFWSSTTSFSCRPWNVWNFLNPVSVAPWTLNQNSYTSS